MTIRAKQTLIGKTNVSSVLRGPKGDPGPSSIPDIDQIGILMETDMLPAVHDSNGAILTDEKGNIVLRY